MAKDLRIEKYNGNITGMGTLTANEVITTSAIVGDLSVDHIDVSTLTVSSTSHFVGDADFDDDIGVGGTVTTSQLAVSATSTFTGQANFGADIEVSGFIVTPKASGSGMKVDLSTPTFGWKDLLGKIETRPSAGGGAAALPDYVVYRTPIYAFRFGTNAPNNHLHEAFIEFHIPHDYVPGTDIYIHTHWSQIVVDTGGAAGVPGVAEWCFDISYADGYGTEGGSGDPFVAPKALTVTQQGSTTQYAHMLAEVVISGATDTATTFDRTKFKVDGLILARVCRDPGNAADTLNQDTFLHFVDMHYQSTNVATKNKNTPFYT